MQKYKNFWRLIVKLIKEKDVFFNASAITFNLFICAVPFTLILISIIGYILSIDAAFEEMVRYGRELFPSFTYESRSGDMIRGAITLETLLKPLIQSRQAFGIAGVIILIFFVQGLFHTIKHVVFEIFEFEDRSHPIIEMIYSFFTSGIVGSVFIFFSLAISFVSLISFDKISIPYINVQIETAWIYDLFNYTIPVLFTFLLFYIIFRYISEKRIQPKVALVGTLVYTVLFEVAKFGLGLYLQYAVQAYQYFYQGYTIAIIIGLWAFYSAALFVVSTIVARAYQDLFVKTPALKENPYTTIS